MNDIIYVRYGIVQTEQPWQISYENLRKRSEASPQIRSLCSRAVMVEKISFENEKLTFLQQVNKIQNFSFFLGNDFTSVTIT